jgi:serine/threonine protein kinase/Flp pilus assembly protein TadD
MTPERWEQVGKLYQTALALPPSEREIFLDDACAADTAMRREVESLLAAEGDAGGFLNAGAMKDAAKLLVEDKSLLLVGKELGHYHVLSLLGSGGMGEVYLAEDTRLRRKVALKLLPAELTANRDRLLRFEQEARAASALNHPNILTIHEIGEAEDRRFIAAEFVDGETLRSRLLSGPLKIGEALRFAEQAASAIAAAHAAGIIHRDIKPENIMLREDGLVKVLDFGLAKLTEKKTEDVDNEATTRAQVNTQAGMILGTVAYMSPEQVRGQGVDVRTDLFSFGVVLYEMLAGRLPFEGATVSDMIATILTGEPAPLDENTPPELQRIVRKSLQKKADERYQTVKDLLIDLKNLKHDLDFTAELERSGKRTKAEQSEPTQNQSIHTTSSAEYIASGIRQYKGVFTVALAVLLLGALGFGYWFYNHRSSTATQIESIAVLPFQNASGNPDVEYLSDGMTELLINSLSQLPKLNVKGRSSVFRYKGKEVEAQTIGADLNVQAVLMGRITQRGDELILNLSLEDARTGNRIWGEQYNRKLMDLVVLQGEIARDVSQKLRFRLTGKEQQRLTRQGTQNTEAYQAYLRGRFYWNKGVAPGFEKSRDYYQQAIELDPTYALAYAGLAEYYGFASAFGLLPPNENWPKAEAATNKALALDDTLAEPYNPLAAVKLFYYRDWTAAERAFRRGIELDPNSAEIHAHYATNLIYFGRNEEVLAEARRSVELDPLSPRYNYFWGRDLVSMRQYDRAIDQFRKTLELDPNYVMAHEDLGYAYEQKGMQREAVAEWSKALTLRGAGEQASRLERTYAASGFEPAVRALSREQLAKLNERMKRGEYVPAWEYVTAYTRLGDKEQAFAWLNKAVEERNGFVFEVSVNPIYDGFRADPRFADLLRRVGLHQ